MNKKQKGLMSKAVDTQIAPQPPKENKANSSHNSETIYKKRIENKKNQNYNTIKA